MAHIVKIISIKHITHDVLEIIAEKPADLHYRPGQAVDFAINQPHWESEWRSFTFTSHPTENQIAFNIKTYPLHKGVTNQLLSLHAGDEVIIGDVYGDIEYKGEGVFIAGGAGITPFIAIFKDLQKQNLLAHNKLIFANKTKNDIIQEENLHHLLGSDFINVLSDEELANYEHGYISAEIIKKHIDKHTQYFYLCGPPPMMNAVEKHLATLGISSNFIVKEGF